MRIHFLKTTTEHFEPVCDGLKTAEFRKNDRDFRVNDVLYLQEFESADGFSGWNQIRIVTHVTNLDKVGASGYVLLSMIRPSDEEVENIRKFAKVIKGDIYENPST